MSAHQGNMPGQGIHIEEEALLSIDVKQTGNVLKHFLGPILGVSLICMLLAAAYGFAFFQENFKSEATVLINANQLPSLINSMASPGRFFDGMGSEVSPFKNHEEILKSKLLMKRVLGKFSSDKDIPQKIKKEKTLQKSLNAFHIKGTDFIQVSAINTSPEVAEKLNQYYLSSYQEVINEIANAPLIQQREIYDRQLVLAKQNLKILSDKMQAYQEFHRFVDITEKSQLKVSKLEQLNTDINAEEATLAEKNAEVAALKGQLQVGKKDISSMIQSVARGQDNTLSDLQSKLQEIEKDYHAKALIYAPTNPDMKQLQDRISVLKKQVMDQQILSAGVQKEFQSQVQGQANNTQIKDSVRTELIRRLAEEQATATAIAQKLNKMYHQRDAFNEDLKTIPQQQLEYAQLQLEKKNKEDIQNRIRDKLAELQIQISGLQNKIVIVDPPNVPTAPLFPNRLHIILLSGIFGLLASSAGALGYSKKAKHQVDSQFIESALHLPVLSILPISHNPKTNKNKKYSNLPLRKGLSNIELVAQHPGISLEIVNAYQETAVYLKTQREKYNSRTFAVSSIQQETDQSAILINIAHCLAQSGENVLLIDANLRNPNLHTAFDHELNYDHGLIELTNSLSEFVANKPEILSGASQEVISQIIQPCIFFTDVHPKLHYLNAGAAIENAFAFINSEGFRILVHLLKEQYHWVFLNAPPCSAGPDTSVLSGYTDGLILRIEPDASVQAVTSAYHKLQKVETHITGCFLQT